jgi:hypothetical protein
VAEGQGHLFEHWPPPLKADADKHKFFKQVRVLIVVKWTVKKSSGDALVLDESLQ